MKMDDLKFAGWAASLNLGQDAIDLIQRTRTSPPARAVQGGRSNVRGRYPSQKMGVTIQFESHTAELAYIILAEHDRNVKEFYDQPGLLKLPYRTLDNKPMAYLHYPDFLVLEEKAVYWVQVKYKAELLDLQGKSPNRYFLDGTKWRCLPGEEYAQRYGLEFRVEVADDFPRIFIRNCNLLADYFIGEPSVDVNKIEVIKRLIGAQVGISLKDILEHDEAVAAAVRIDDVYTLLVQEQIYVNLHRCYLGDHGSVEMYRDEALAFAAESLRSTVISSPSVLTLRLEKGETIFLHEQEFKILLIKGELITCRRPDGREVQYKVTDLTRYHEQGFLSQTPKVDKVSDHLLSASPKQLEMAKDRQLALLHGDADYSRRTYRRWKERQDEELVASGHSLIGLIPKYHACGNRDARYDDETEKLAEAIINTEYRTDIAPTKSAAYGLFRLTYKETFTVEPVPSYRWFANLINQVPKHDLETDRKSRRAGYAVQPFCYRIEHDTPPQGDHPWDIGHIDHTQLEIELISDSGSSLGRPWLTLFYSAFSRKVLAFHLCFDPPSYRSCMNVIRQCVKTHRRVTKTIVIDNGTEFDSKYFEVLLAAMIVTKKSRPPHNARFGAVIERFFGTANTQFIGSLKGNTKLMKSVRLVTKSVNPKNLAIWTLPALHESLAEYISIYHNNVHVTLNASPNDHFEQGLEHSGARSHRLVPYDETFKMLTMPAPKRDLVKITVAGVSIRCITYTCSAFSEVGMMGKRVKVRYDPYDANIAYAYVRGLWHKCFSSHPSSFMGKSEKVIMLATEELRAIHKQTSNHRLEISSAKLAAYLRSTRSKEIILQQEKDAALEAIESGTAYSPISLPAPSLVPPPSPVMPALVDAPIEAYPEDSL